MTVNQVFEEIQVFADVAERTGNRVARNNIRQRRGACRSLTELASKWRRFGDGFYYLPSSAWPPGLSTLNLRKPWRPASAA